MKPNLQVRLRSTLSLLSRKAVKKTIHKALWNLKGMENKRSASINEERVSMLKEVEGVTITAFESLLSLI